MKIKYKIIDLSNNPDDLQPGDVVKLCKGMRIGQRYKGWTLYKYMRYTGYHIILGKVGGIFQIEGRKNKCGDSQVFGYPKHMLDLTCVKRLIKGERLS